MGLESVINTIADLNPANPSSSDLVREGDNHIRVIKDALKKTFPEINAVITASSAEINKLDGLLATQAELNKLNLVTVSTAEMNFLVGVTSLIQNQINALNASINAIQSSIPRVIAPGALMHFAVTATPSGWLPANGDAVSRATYAGLFAVLGTSYGIGNGTTTFNLPDYRGTFLRALDDGRGIDPGRVKGTYQDTANLSHTHTGSSDSAGDHQHDIGYVLTAPPNGVGVYDGNIGEIFNDRTVAGSGALTKLSGGHTHSVAINGDGTYESRPRNYAERIYIKT